MKIESAPRLRGHMGRDPIAPGTTPAISVRTSGGLAVEGGPPVRDSYLVFGRPLIGEEEIAEVVATLRSGWLGTGPKAHAFEKQVAAYLGVRHAVGLNSCTAALDLALEVAGVGPGDAVVTTPMTFVATANAIVNRGARPVFADIELESMNVDVGEIGRRLSRRTKALLPVHMGGRAYAVDAVNDLARSRGLTVIADAAHALETRWRGVSVGPLADLSAYSFYVTKNLTTGEGGMLTTSRADWAEEVRRRSLHGLDTDAWNRYSGSGYRPYEAVYPGHKYNLSDIAASIGIHQLARVEENWRRRDEIWRLYGDGFATVSEIVLPRDEEREGNRHARHLYAILLRLEALTVDRGHFVAALRAENIGCGVHFEPVHLHRYYRERFGYRPGDYPVAEWVGERTVSLPLSAGLSDDDVDDVVAAVKKVLEHTRRRRRRRP